MKQSHIINTLLILVLVVSSAFFNEIIGQCPMCKMSAESNMANGGTAGKGLNTGILYLLSLPYIMGIFFVYVWRKNRKAEAEVFAS